MASCKGARRNWEEIEKFILSSEISPKPPGYRSLPKPRLVRDETIVAKEGQSGETTSRSLRQRGFATVRLPEFDYPSGHRRSNAWWAKYEPQPKCPKVQEITQHIAETLPLNQKNDTAEPVGSRVPLERLSLDDVYESSKIDVTEWLTETGYRVLTCSPKSESQPDDASASCNTSDGKPAPEIVDDKTPTQGLSIVNQALACAMSKARPGSSSTARPTWFVLAYYTERPELEPNELSTEPPELLCELWALQYHATRTGQEYPAQRLWRGDFYEVSEANRVVEILRYCTSESRIDDALSNAQTHVRAFRSHDLDYMSDSGVIGEDGYGEGTFEHQRAQANGDLPPECGRNLASEQSLWDTFGFDPASLQAEP
ncbi:hypothetical protein LTR37_014198 [Vermiconidia calcicola]|uniref:Uncharacterized protein n=1 Tax=Vermiconidia calcicola TaxID=1690605 RepID=A0ACC3MV44_9PEZI|nr:hypothetical protein LTR37_014198 [Vermiconidia calcicola]